MAFNRSNIGAGKTPSSNASTSGWATTGQLSEASSGSSSRTPPPHFAPTSSGARFVGASGALPPSGSSVSRIPPMTFFSPVRAGPPSVAPPFRPSFAASTPTTPSSAPTSVSPLVNSQRAVPPHTTSISFAPAAPASMSAHSAGTSTITSYAVGPSSATSLSFAPSSGPRNLPSSFAPASPLAATSAPRTVIPASRAVSATGADSSTTQLNGNHPSSPGHRQWDPNSFAPENLPRSTPLPQHSPNQSGFGYSAASTVSAALPDKQQTMEEEEDFVPFASQEPADPRHIRQQQHHTAVSAQLPSSNISSHQPPVLVDDKSVSQSRQQNEHRHQHTPSVHETIPSGFDAIRQAEHPPTEQTQKSEPMLIENPVAQQHSTPMQPIRQHADSATGLHAAASSPVAPATTTGDSASCAKVEVSVTRDSGGSSDAPPHEASTPAPTSVENPQPSVGSEVQGNVQQEVPKPQTTTLTPPAATHAQPHNSASPTRQPKIALPCPSPLRPQKSSGTEPEELKRFIADREREISILRDMITQEKNQTRHYQMEVFEKERKERELESRLQQLASAVAFKDKEVLEIQHELEKMRKIDSAAAAAAAATTPISSSPNGKKTNSAATDGDGHLAQALAEAASTDNDRLFEFLLEDSIDSLSESQPPDEETLLADGLTSHTGAATFRSLRRKSEANVKPLKLKSAAVATGAPSSSNIKSAVKSTEVTKTGSGAPGNINKTSPKKVRIASPPVPVPAVSRSATGQGNHARRGGRGGAVRREGADNGSTTPTRRGVSVRDNGDSDDENHRLQAELARMKEKWRGIKRAINGQPIAERERTELMRETRHLRTDLRDILREELAAFGSTFLANYHNVSSSSAHDHEIDAAADITVPSAKRQRKEDTPTTVPKGEAEKEEAALSNMSVVEGEQTAAPESLAPSDTERQRLREELEREVRAQLEKEMEVQIEKERQRAKAIADEMKSVKRKTKVVYERYGDLKRKKMEIEEQMKRTEKENADLKRANASFVERNDALSARVREAQELAQTAEKRRDKIKALKKHKQELILFKQRQAERVESLEAERDEARRAVANLEKRLDDTVGERDVLTQRTGQLEKHNHDLLNRMEMVSAEIAKIKSKLARKNETIEKLQQELARERATSKEEKKELSADKTKSEEKQKVKAAEDEDEDLSPPITPTGLTCLTATQGDPLAATPGFPFSMPSTMLPDSQESEDIFADIKDAAASLHAGGSPRLDEDDDVDEPDGEPAEKNR